MEERHRLFKNSPEMTIDEIVELLTSTANNIKIQEVFNISRETMATFINKINIGKRGTSNWLNLTLVRDRVLLYMQDRSRQFEAILSNKIESVVERSVNNAIKRKVEEKLNNTLTGDNIQHNTSNIDNDNYKNDNQYENNRQDTWNTINKLIENKAEKSIEHSILQVDNNIILEKQKSIYYEKLPHEMEQLDTIKKLVRNTVGTLAEGNSVKKENIEYLGDLVKMLEKLYNMERNAINGGGNISFTKVENLTIEKLLQQNNTYNAEESENPYTNLIGVVNNTNNAIQDDILDTNSQEV